MKKFFTPGNILRLGLEITSQNNPLYIGKPASFVEDINAWRFYPTTISESKIVVFVNYAITEDEFLCAPDSIYSNDISDSCHCIVLFENEFVVCHTMDLHFI